MAMKGKAIFKLTRLLLVSISLWKITLCNTIKIRSALDFYQFSKNVGDGTQYQGTTIFLEEDINQEDISYTFEAQGTFSGTFDGQGHVIEGFKVTANTHLTGLFWILKGAIKNVILGPKGKLVNNYYTSGGNQVLVGGLAAYCEYCTLKNNINAVPISVDSYIEENTFVGGIVGCVDEGGGTFINCANYGQITYSGSTSAYAEIGGIIGFGESVEIANCLNYGTIYFSSDSANIVGGIASSLFNSDIKNCVNTGTLPLKLTTSGIVSIISETTMENCYWDGTNNCSGYILAFASTVSKSYSFDQDTLTLSRKTSVGGYTGFSLVEALNGCARMNALKGYSYWLSNKQACDIFFVINEKMINTTFPARISFLFSFLTEGENVFYGWYTDETCTTQLMSYEISQNTTLYGKLTTDSNTYTIFFDARGGTLTTSSISSKVGKTVSLLTNAKRNNCYFMWWETEYGEKVTSSITMPAENITLYAMWACTRISSAEDLIGFSENVDLGESYSGTTVFLDADINFSEDLSKRFEPIGKSYDFKGTFDGQGHTINGLKMNSLFARTGLFGFSGGLTIRNLVIGATSSFLSFAYSSGTFVGGFVALCNMVSGPCIIENSVNMANVSFSGETTSNNFIAGFAGYFGSDYGYRARLVNCANYGSISDQGTSKQWKEIGGIAGFCAKVTVTNCANYGNLIQGGTTENMLMGGIVGTTYMGCIIENSVNFGEISASFNGGQLGNIVGFYRFSTISNCYWNEKSGYGLYDWMFSSTTHNCSSYKSDTYELSETVSTGGYTGRNLIDALNAFTRTKALYNLSQWELNDDGSGISFFVDNKRAAFSLDSEVMLLPNFAGNHIHQFDGWYTDERCTFPLTDFDLVTNESLYGRWKESLDTYVIAFDTRGGATNVEPQTAEFGKMISLPKSLAKEGCTFGFWETTQGDKVSFNFTVPGHDVTLHAVWACSHIYSFSEFIAFGEAVNSGAEFNGKTVFLDTDIDFLGGFSQLFEPIGNFENSFKGTFNGQGHVVKNLNMYTANWDEVGLFGSTSGATIKNIVLDTSCYVDYSYQSKTASVTIGGLVGYSSTTEDKPGAIEGVVNMAEIYISGNTLKNESFYVGGVAGLFYSHNTESFVRNCANYGKITYSGESKNVFVGGITGGTHQVKVQNCLNYGKLLYTSDEDEVFSLGGISGGCEDSVIENCISAGLIFSESYYETIRIIVGYTSKTSKVIHSFWTEEAEEYVLNNDTDYTDSNTTTQGAEKIDLNNVDNVKKLNSYADKHNFNKWLINPNENTVHFVMSKDSAQHSFREKAIIKPNHPDSERRRDFYELRWCLDSGKCDVNVVTKNHTTFIAVWDLKARTVADILLGDFFGIFIVLFVIVCIYFVVLLKKDKLKFNHETFDIEIAALTQYDQEHTARIADQMKATKTVSDENWIRRKLEPYSNHLGRDENETANEVISELGVESSGEGAVGVYRTKGVAPAITKALEANENLNAVAEYLNMLYKSVNEYTEYHKLYFGIKNVEGFRNEAGSKINFTGLVSGFTNKNLIINALAEGEKDGLPRGILFKVYNGRGYNIGEVSDFIEEVLFKENSVFIVEKVRVPIAGRYIVVKLSFVPYVSATEDNNKQ